MPLKINGPLVLVPINLDYTEEVFENFTEAVIRYLLVEEVPKQREDTMAFIETSMEQRQKGTDLVWVILYMQQFAGCCGLHNIQTKQPHFGIWLREELQGKGLGKQVVQYVLNWGLDNLEVEFIKYPVDQRNTPSVRLIRGLGLKVFDHYQAGVKKLLEIDEYRLYK